MTDFGNTERRKTYLLEDYGKLPEKLLRKDMSEIPSKKGLNTEKDTLCSQSQRANFCSFTQGGK